MELSVAKSTSTSQTIVAVAGVIDVYTAPKLRDALDRLLGGGYPDLVVDLTDVDFIDSTGLGVLVGRLKHAKVQGGTVHLVLTNEKVKKVFTLTGLEALFTMHPSIEDAERAFTQGSQASAS